jgi:hypothetical protein
MPPWMAVITVAAVTVPGSPPGCRPAGYIRHLPGRGRRSLARWQDFRRPPRPGRMVRAGRGYLMVGEDGGIFDFSGTPDGFQGSLGAHPPAHPITSVAVLEG